MILYHTSYVSVKKPEVKYSRDYLDFGKGFYLTSFHEQAVRYAERFRRRRMEAWISTYRFDFEPSEWNILQLFSYNKAWLDFVAKCRAGDDDTDYDLVIGGIANDKVIRTLDRYFLGEISQEEALGLLKFEKPNIQYCIRNQNMLDICIKHLNSLQL